MDDKDRKCLRSNASFIGDHMYVDDGFLNKLFQEEILSQSMKEKIQVQQTKQEKITELMSHLPRRGPNAFRCFVEALVDTDQDHVADRLSREIAEAHRMARDARSAPPLTGRLFGTAPAKVPITPPAPPAQPALAQTQETALLNVKVRTIDEPDAKIINNSDVYKVNSATRGRAVIINNESFHVLPRRHGSQFDFINAEQLFNNLHFTTVPYLNKTAQELRDILRDESRHGDLERSDMFVLVLMSHGDNGVVYGIDGKPVYIQSEIMTAFNGQNCPQLVGKPKVFLIQACQGDVDTSGVIQSDSGDGLRVPSGASGEPSGGDSSDAAPLLKRVHEQLDMVISYSTVPGYKSWRHEALGSWFIRAVVQVFAEHACNDHLLELLRKVRNMITERHTIVGRYIQVTRTSETLSKNLYFLPGYSPSAAPQA